MSPFRIGLADLTRLQRDWAALLPGMAFVASPAPSDQRLQEIPTFGRNPGGLRMLTYVPPDLPPKAPLVVALHGCDQDAGSFDLETGWSVLAERHGFALLYPEQTRRSNAHRCFNWFEPGDSAREMASICQMITAMLLNDRCDPARVTITGLSAGGATAAAMLATYPNLFAAGAIIAGLPFGAARQTGEALAAMAHSPKLSASEWGDKVRTASPGAVRRPVIALWHGDADTTVAPSNALASAKQWTDVHGIPEPLGEEDFVDGVPHRTWRNQAGRVCVELYAVPGMGHGVAVAPGTSGERGIGKPGRYVLNSPIASTWHIARAWDLVPPEGGDQPAPVLPLKLKQIGRGLHKLVQRVV